MLEKLRELMTKKARPNWSEDTIQKVWEKGTTITGKDPSKYRLDSKKNIIKREQYGNKDEKEGWEIDHIIPRSKGGLDLLNNLQPLQWEENKKKSDSIES